jgi:hypothetical protein
MLEYTVDGKLYEVSEDLLDQFMAKYPNAIKVEKEEPGKQTPQVPGAPVEETAAPDMVFSSETTSLVSQEPSQIADDSYLDLIVKTVNNLQPMFASSIEKAKAGALDYLKIVGGEDLTDFLLKGNLGGVAYVDPETNQKVTFKQDPDRWRELNSINQRKDQEVKRVYDDTNVEVGTATRKQMVDLFNKATDYDLQVQYTGSVIKGFKEGSVKEVVGGGLSAISSLATTMIPAIATRGASLYPQVAGSMYYSYNTEKAKSKYGEDPEALKKLVDNNEVELGVPMALGGLATYLENIGLKGITNKIINTPLKGKGAVLKLWGMLGEGSTEYAQSLVETYNDSLGFGKTNEEALSDVIDALDKEETWEAAIQGFLGAGIVGQGVRQINQANAAARKHTGNSVGQSLDMLGMLRQVNANSQDEQVKKAASEKEKQLIASIKEKVEEGNEIAANLTEEESKTIVSADQALETFKKQLAELNEKAKNGLISREEQAIAVDVYKKQFEEAKATIKQNIDSAKDKISKKNKETADKNLQLIEVLEDPDSTPTQIQRAKDALINNNMGIVQKLVRTKFDPNKDTELTREDFEGDLMLELAKMINTFDSSKGEFGAYVATNLPKRIPRIFERRIEKTGTGDFVAKEDVTERRDLMSNDDADINLVEQSKNETVKNITKDLNIPSELTNLVNESVSGIFGTKLPAVTDPKFKTAFQNALRNSMADSVKKNLLGKKTDQFRDFIINNFEALYTNIPQEAFNKRLPGLAEAVTDETGKQVREKTAVGKGVFKKKNITPQELADYFTGDDLTPQLRSNRKVKLAEIIAEELGKDATASVLLNEDVMSKFKEIQELLGQEVPKDFQSKIARLINRIDQLIDAANKAGKDILLADPFGVVAIAKEVFVGSLRVFKMTLEATQSLAKALEAVRKYISENFYNKETSKEVEDKVVQLLQKSYDDPMSVGQADIDTLLEFVADKKGIDLIQFTGEYLTAKYLFEKLSSAKTEDQVLKVIEDFLRLFSKSIGTSFSNPKNPQYRKLSSYDKIFNKIIKPIIKKTHPELVSKFKSETKGGAENIGIKYNGKKLLRYQNSKSLIYNGNFNQLESEAIKARKDLMSLIDDIIEYNDDIFNSIIDLASVDQAGLIRKAAMPGIFVQGLPKSQTQLEHDIPVNLVVKAIKQYKKGEITKGDLEAILDTFKVNLVSKKVDNILTKNGLKQETVEGGRMNIPEVVEQMKKEKYETFNALQKQEESRLEDYSLRVQQMIETVSKGEFKAEDEMSKSEAKAIQDTRKKRFRGFLSPGADDVYGLIQDLYRKGKLGELDNQWFKENLFDLFNDAYIAMNKNIVMKQRLYEKIKKDHKEVFKSLKEKVMGPFTNDMILRVYMYTKSGAKADQLGLSENQVKDMMQYVNDNSDLLALAKDLTQLSDESEYWMTHDDLGSFTAGSIKDDIIQILEKKDRARFFSDFIKRVDAIFTDNVLNKIEAVYGKDFRLSLEDGIYRMKTGRSRSSGVDPQVGAMWNWFRGSVGVTMFFHTRSAILQTISFTNYLDGENNDFVSAAKAFANIDQFAKDFAFIMTSEYLVQRRGGLSTEINMQDLANDLQQSGRKGTRSIISKLLQVGFSFTQAGDSFAISLGGASYYRNQINAYLKQGKSQQEAEKLAFRDFVAKTEESQQSARPDRLSKQQVSMFGKLFLAFQNVTAQMTRIMSKEVKDILAGRGNKRKKMARIAYYFTMQNMLFSFLQNALFAFMFPDDEEEEELQQTKTFRVINNSLDTILRGTGVFGAIISTIKNIALEFIEQERRPLEGKGRADHMYTMIEIMNVSAPIGIKARKVGAMIDSYRYNKGVHERMGADLDNPTMDIIANAVSVGANVPLDRLLNKSRNIKAALDEKTETLHKILLMMGWNTWDLGVSGQREKTAEVKKEIRAEKAAAKKRKKNEGLTEEEIISRSF